MVVTFRTRISGSVVVGMVNAERASAPLRGGVRAGEVGGVECRWPGAGGRARRAGVLRSMWVPCASAAAVALVFGGCVPFLDPARGAGVEIVNEAGVDLVFQYRGRDLPVSDGRTTTLRFSTAPSERCTDEIRVVDVDHTMELVRDEVCDGETWVIEADDLAPIEP